MSIQPFAILFLSNLTSTHLTRTSPVSLCIVSKLSPLLLTYFYL